MSPPGEQHGIFAFRVAFSLGNHVEPNNLGQVYIGEPGFKLAANPDTVRAPDIAFVSRERLDKLTPSTGYRPEAPDLVIEIIPLGSRCARTSPSDRYIEVEEKVFEWLDAGTLMVLVVNPRKRTVSVYRSRHDIHVLIEEDTIDGGDVVPSWTLPVAELFA
jgi:Uma2 family endonuclease